MIDPKKIVKQFESGELQITMDDEQAEKLYKGLKLDEYRAEYDFIKSAIEKQIPMKPCIEKTQFCDNINCPDCGKRLVHRDETGFFAGALNNYCFNCGQRLDWSE